MLLLLKNVKQTANGYTALCPSHNDNRSSLSITESSDNKVLFYCFAGCSYSQILDSLNLPNNKNGNRKEIERIYDYTDESGNILFQNVRYKGKDFRWRRLEKNGNHLWNLNGVRRIPYRLMDLVKLKPNENFVMAEGEKDADTLTGNGLISTNHKNWKPEFNYLLKDKKVVLFQDRDEAGIKQIEKVVKLIASDANEIKVVDCYAGESLPKKRGKDVSDYLEDHSFEKLFEFIQNTPPLNSSEIDIAKSRKATNELNVVCLSDIEAKEVEWLWKPFIPIGEFTIVEGIEGLGKSWACFALACAVAEGAKLPFSESEPIKPSNVLILSAEDSLEHTVKPRLVAMNANTDKIFAIEEVFSFTDFKDFVRFEEIIIEHEPKLVIIDPIFSYTGGKNLNQESDSRPIARKIIEIAQKYNCAIVGVRHIGKSKGNGDARAAGLGSISWRASSRSVLLVGKDEETNEIAIVQTKTNLAEKAKFGVGFRIIDGLFLWDSSPSSLTAERMLSQVKDDDTKVEQSEAIDFLRDVLQDGECLSIEVQKEAKALGITNYAFRKAKQSLGIKSIKKGGNFGGEKGWYLTLSETETVDSKEIQHLQSKQGNKTSYNNSLAEVVENVFDENVQDVQPTSSKELVPRVEMKTTCVCGADGLIGKACAKCGKVIIPF